MPINLFLFLLLTLPVFAEEPAPKPEPTSAELKAEIEQLKQRQQISDARCKALAEFYQADAALRQMDSAPKAPTALQKPTESKH